MYTIQIVIFTLIFINKLINCDKHLIRVQTVENINVFKSDYPESHVIPLSLSSSVNGQLTYTIGARIAGDRLAATGARNQNWPNAQNVALTLTYPSSGVGLMVNYVVINVAQSNSLGQAYVVHGGLGQRTISIVVEAYSVTYMNYNVAIYGH